MASDIKVTRSMIKLLRHLLHQRNLCKPVTYLSANAAEGIGSGSFYPHIRRLEVEGWVEADWEEVDAGLNRPPRRFYYLTVTGAALAQAAVERHDPRPSFLDRLMSRRPR